jgi:beta-phosphoglucomutase
MELPNLLISLHMAIKEEISIDTFSTWLFDYDGVVADTMHDNFKAWQHACEIYGAHLKKEDYFPFEGLSSKGMSEHLGNIFGLSQSEYSTLPQKKAEFYKLHTGPLRIYPGVEDLLSLLKHHDKKLALVSGAGRQRIEETTPSTLLDIFDAIVAGDDISKPKPDPEPYVLALTKVGGKLNDAIVIENAPLGIISAKAANMYCIALTTTLDRESLKSADGIFTGIPELMDLIAK